MKSNVPFDTSEQFRRYGYIEYPFMTKHYDSENTIRSVSFYFAQFIDKKGTVRRRCVIRCGTKSVFDPVKKKIRSIVWSKEKKKLHVSGNLSSQLDWARGLSKETRGSVRKLEHDLRSEWIEEAIPLYNDFPFLPSLLLEKLNGFRGIKELTKYYTGSRSKGCTSAMTRFLQRENCLIRMTRAHNRANGYTARDHRLSLLKKFGRQLGPEWCVRVLDDTDKYSFDCVRTMSMRLKDSKRVAPIPAVAEFLRTCMKTGLHDYYLWDVVAFLNRVVAPDEQAFVEENFPAVGVTEAHTLILRLLGVGNARAEVVPAVSVPRLNTTFNNDGRPEIEVFEEGYTVRYPKDSEELREWGVDQHHCISGYAGQHERKECHLFGVFINNKLKACGQLGQGKVFQFFAACNQLVQQDLLEKMKKHLVWWDWSPTDRHYAPFVDDGLGL